MLSNASLIAKHTLKIGATNHHHSIPSRFTNWANIAGTMKAITIGPRTVPASFTEWARTAKANSIATTNIANNNTESSKLMIDQDERLGIPRVSDGKMKIIANSKPTNWKITLVAATTPTANHFPYNNSIFHLKNCFLFKIRRVALC